MDHSAVPIVWVGPEPDSERIAAVRADIGHNLSGMKRPSRLIYHHVQLTNDSEGPCVVLWGRERQSCFYAEYHAETKWVSLDEMAEMIDDGHGDPA